MLDGLVLCRRQAGGRRSGTAVNDVLFSRVKDGKGESLSVRFNGDVMKKLRWIAGDFVVASPKDQGTRWVFERVQGKDHKGIKLCSSNCASGGAVVRYTLDEHVLDLIFSDGNKQFTGTLCDSEGNKAIVLVD